MEPLSSLPADARFGDVFTRLWLAQQQLEALLNNSVFTPSLRSSRPFAETLLRSIREQLTAGDMDRILSMQDVGLIKIYADEFKLAFLAEMAMLPAYFVTQKGSHDTLTLLDQAHRLFPDDLHAKVPEAMFDVIEAGKALAYETATACGFHVFRAVEAVLRRYYTEVTGGRPHPKVRVIAVYVNAMQQRKCGDEKILSTLKQLSTLHRNPLIHPDVVLTNNEAISLVGMAHSAITAMLAALPAVLPTTTSPGSATATA
jgi:hypothetical protein